MTRMDIRGGGAPAGSGAWSPLVVGAIDDHLDTLGNGPPVLARELMVRGEREDVVRHASGGRKALPTEQPAELRNLVDRRRVGETDPLAIAAATARWLRFRFRG
jgi:hypothetical protein